MILDKLVFHSIKINRSGRLIMDLLQQRWKKLRLLLQWCFIYSLPIFLSACAATQDQQIKIEQASDVKALQQQETIVEPEPIPLSPELMFSILAAEIAGQRGEIGTAVELYKRAAELVDSPAVAGRAAQIATFTRNQQRIDHALKRWIEVDPDNADIYIMQVAIFMLQDDYDQVVKAVDTAIELEPDNTQAYLADLAENLNKYAKPQQALTVLQQLQAFQNNNIDALISYVRLAAFYKHYDDALSAVDKVLKQEPNHEGALILKAEIHQRLGDGEQALRVLSKVARNSEASDDLRFAYAKLLGENNQIIQAQQIFEQLRNDDPENDETIFALGLIALELKDGLQAKKYFSQLIKQGDQGLQAAYFMGLAETMNEDIDAALVWFASVSVDSHRFQSAQSRYINLLAERGEIDKARLHLKLLRKENPDRVVQYFLFEASFLREQGLDQAAFDLYGEALKQHPGQTELLYSRAMVAEPLNQLGVLEQDLNQILAKDPNNAQALNALGYTLADRTNRHQEALILIERAVSIKPDDPFYLDSLGWVHYRLGHLDKAQRYLEQAVELQADAEFLAHLGEVLWQQGKRKDAKKLWQRARSENPENKLLSETIRRLDPLMVE